MKTVPVFSDVKHKYNAISALININELSIASNFYELKTNIISKKKNSRDEIK